MRFFITLLLLLKLSSQPYAITYYISNTASGNGTGRDSWSNCRLWQYMWSGDSEIKWSSSTRRHCLSRWRFYRNNLYSPQYTSMY